MKTLYITGMGMLMAAAAVTFTSCGDYDPKCEALPQLPTASNLKAEVTNRTVNVSWQLPSSSNITDVRLIINGNGKSPVSLGPTATSYTAKGQEMGKDLMYTVKVCYDIDGREYISEGVSTTASVPVIETKMLYLLPEDVASYTALTDDDELAAAKWFAAQPNAEFVHPSELAGYDPEVYSVMWIEVDRVGIGFGWQNLPFASDDCIAALKAYSAEGGSLYLSNMATELTVPLGIVPDDMAPTVFGDGNGGSGDDVWVINPYLGWDFRNGSDQGFYDRTGHAVFAGLTLEDPNNYGYETLPLIGPGQREDHNCLWDCNIYGKGQFPDVIANFEATTNSLVLATWGHVRDHCVAGMVEFYSTSSHGRCIANGLAAYEWNQNSGVNPYQANIEKLTSNILNYLK